MTSPEIVIIDTPNLGDRSYVVHARPRSSSTPSATSTACWRCWPSTAARHPRPGDPHPQRLRHRRPGAGPRSWARPTSCPAATTLAVRRAASCATGTSFSSGRDAWRAMHTPGHTPHHLSYVVAVDGSDAAVFTGGSLLFGSVGRPDLIGPAMTRGAGPRQWHSVRRIDDRGRPAGRRVPDPRVRLVLQRHAHHRPGLDDRRAGARPTRRPSCRGAVRRRAARRAGRLPGLLRAHGAGEPAGPGADRPVAARARRRRRAAAPHRRRGVGGRPAQPPASSPPATCAGTLSLRRRGQRGHLPRLAHPVGHPGDPARRDPRAGRRAMQRELVAHRHRPAGRVQHWAPRSTGRRARRTWRTYPVVDFPSSRTALARRPSCCSSTPRRNGEWADGHVAGARHVPLHELPGRIEEVRAWSRAAAPRRARPDGCGSPAAAASARRWPHRCWRAPGSPWWPWMTISTRPRQPAFPLFAMTTPSCSATRTPTSRPP